VSSSGSSVRKRHGRTRESPTKGHEDDSGTGASLPSGKTERARTVQPGEEKAEGQSDQCMQIPAERVQRKQSQALFSGAQWQGKRQWAQNETQQILSEHKQTLFLQ